MFHIAGEKLKKIAIVLFILDVVGSIIGFIALATLVSPLVALGGLGGGFFMTWFSCAILFTLGDSCENVDILRSASYKLEKNLKELQERQIKMNKRISEMQKMLANEIEKHSKED